MTSDSRKGVYSEHPKCIVFERKFYILKESTLLFYEHVSIIAYHTVYILSGLPEFSDQICLLLKE